MVQPINELKSQHDPKLNWLFLCEASAASVAVKETRVTLESGQCTIFSCALRITRSYCLSFLSFLDPSGAAGSVISASGVRTSHTDQH